MAKLTTTESVLYDARHSRSSVVEIEIMEFSEMANGNFLAKVSDFYYKPITITNDANEQEAILQRLEWWNRPIVFTALQVAQLSAMISPLIPEGTDEPMRREVLKQQALLYYVQNDFINTEQTKCVYNTLPSVWVITE